LKRQAFFMLNNGMRYNLLSVLFAGSLLLVSGPNLAAPYTPTNDAEVIERLPGRASDPATRRVESLRKQLAARPADAALRVDIARRYFDMAMAQGDPRYVGYAAGALAPLAKTVNNPSGTSADYFLVRGMIEQFSHAFEPALASLLKASQLNPTSAEPLLWRSAIFMVQANYPAAAQECNKLVPLAEPLLVTGCNAYVAASTQGGLDTAFATLAAAVKTHANSSPELLLWQYTRLAEMALRLQRFDTTEDYYRRALALGVTDQFLLGSYADFLIDRQRSPEVLQLLNDWERSDILLLRLALAAKNMQDPRAANWATQLRTRFADAARRGDRLHEQEAARFELDIEGSPSKAVALASANYAIQKEPRDAEVLMRAALAAGQADRARPALAWWRATGYEDPHIDRLAMQLVSKGAEK
jgi:tetratricopeptide (TPR) repeat protein